MDDDHDNNRVRRIPVSPSPPPPSPPLGSFIAALTIATLIFMCIYVFSNVVSVAVVLALCIASVFIFRFVQGNKSIGSVVRFASKATASSSSDCAICLENFKNREECLVFPFCGHLFHQICINHWLKNKHTCPICRHRIPPSTTKITETVNTEFLANLV